MTDKTSYYEGIYTVRVLSDRPQGDVSGTDDLVAVLQECYDGDFIGEVVSGEAREVTPGRMCELLHAAGSEPGFFNL